MNDDKQQYNTARDILKVIAIIAMTADHASTAFFAEETVLYGICQFFGNLMISNLSPPDAQSVEEKHYQPSYVDDSLSNTTEANMCFWM